MPSLSQGLWSFDAIAVMALLGFAAWRDVLTRTIPDGVSIALIVVGCLVRLAAGWEALAVSLLVGAGVFILLLPACSRGLLGGADLKLLASLAIGLAPLSTLHLIAAVTVVGGGLAVFYLGLRRLITAWPAIVARRTNASSFLERIVSIECWRVRRSAPLPYGVAIAIGAAIIVLNRQGV